MVKLTFNVKMAAAEAEIYPSATSALRKCFEELPAATLTIEEQPPSSRLQLRPDFVVHVTHMGRQTDFIAELKKSGEPQYVRTAISQIHFYRRSQNLPGASGIFIAPYISEAAAKLCRDEGMSYLDLAGNCHISFDGVYIHIEGKPNPDAHSRPLRSLYQPKAERILRVVLTHPPRPWRIQALAEEAEVSVGQTFKVKELLLEKEWLVESEHGIALTKPRELLNDWAEHYRFSKHRVKQFYTLMNLNSFERDLSDAGRALGVPCAFTSFAAAAQYAPYATYQRTTAYIHHELAGVHLTPLQLMPVETGANVILLAPYDDGVFYGVRQRQDVSLVSPIQTYLDLQSAGGRGREAAEVLFQKEIAPKW